VGTRVTLLTDFGTADGYAAAMRGVLATLAPAAIVEDASHAIEPGDVRAAAWALGRYWSGYPEGTIHIVVVDPGVGGDRRGLAVECGGRFGVGPDNGVLTPILSDTRSRTVSIENREYMLQPVSSTFHGRDVFAPAAAHLARGVPLEALGPAVEDPIRLASAGPAREGDVVSGVVMHVDRFGNLITNVGASVAEGAVEVIVEALPVGPVRTTYSAVARGERLALVGSSGLLEIAVRDGSAAATLGAGRGARVIVKTARNA
jgi:S-adenosylmethionine hydrolase